MARAASRPAPTPTKTAASPKAVAPASPRAAAASHAKAKSTAKPKAAAATSKPTAATSKAGPTTSTPKAAKTKAATAKPAPSPALAPSKTATKQVKAPAKTVATAKTGARTKTGAAASAGASKKSATPNLIAVVSKPATASSKGRRDGALRVGDKAPPFDLPADDGKRYRLADLRGKTVVLFFYPRDSTPGCTAEACAFSTLRGFQDQGIVVLGVSADSLASHAKFRSKYDLSVPLLSDADRSVMVSYNSYGEKLMYGKPVMGIIRSTFVIDAQGIIQAVYQPVRGAAEHPAAVLADLVG